MATSLSRKSVPETGAPELSSTRNAPPARVEPSIGWEKRTSSSAPGSTSAAPGAGKDSSTVGASAIWVTTTVANALAPPGSVTRATMGVMPPASVENLIGTL